MISWIQRTFQQHFKWLFLALLILVIISFVFITNASSGFGHVAKQAPARPFYGLNLGSAEDTKELVRDATLSVQLHGMQMSNEGQFQQYALQRVAALHLASELNLPAPANDEVVRHIQSLRAFAGADGQFDSKRYTAFRDSLKTNPQLHESDVSRVIADDVTYQLVLKLLAGPGYVLPADVQQQLNRSDTTWTLQAVTIDYPSFKPTVAVTAEALGKFLEFNAGNYEIGPKAGVSYIEFAAAAYADKVSFTEANLRAYYDANVARFTKPAADKPAVAATPDADFAAARSQVEEAYKADRAKALADAAASDLAVALFDGKVTAATLDGFLAARQLNRKSLAPFNADSIPAELGADRSVAEEALKTGPQRLFSDPVHTPRGVAILVWNETLPARQPALDEIKDRVTTDYVESEKRKRFSEAGTTLRSAIEARLKAGDSLAKAVTACAASIPAKLDTKSWPAFTLAKPPQDLDYSIFNAIKSLDKGALSPMVTTREQGLIVYAADKVLPSADATSPKFTETRTRLAAYTASRNGSEVLAEMVTAELAKSAPVAP
jgi:peptidyl-prolyl cis-trans isomerase D